MVAGEFGDDGEAAFRSGLVCLFGLGDVRAERTSRSRRGRCLLFSSLRLEGLRPTISKWLDSRRTIRVPRLLCAC